MSKMLGKSLPVGLTFSYPTVDALVEFLITKTSNPAATELGATNTGNQVQSILDDLDQLLNDTPL
jgi:hexokinase